MPLPRPDETVTQETIAGAVAVATLLRKTERIDDPAAAARAIERPMLILQGEADRNVTMTDFHHLFMTRTGLPSKDYAQPGHVSEAVLDDIARWIRANSAARQTELAPL